MIYKSVNSMNFRYYKRAISIFLIFSYAATLNSCMTTNISYQSPESYDSGSHGEIIKIELKNKIRIDCKDKIVRLKKESDSDGFIVIISADTVKNGSNGFNYKTQWNEIRIPFPDVQKILLEDSEVNGWKTVLFIFGIIIVSFGLFFIFYVIPEFKKI